MASPPPYPTAAQERNPENRVPQHTSPPHTSPPPYYAEEDYPAGYPHACPPAYNDIVKPPTYDEVEAMHRHSALREIFNLSDDEFDFQDRSVSHGVPREEDDDCELEIGSYYSFLACFFLSFILNWIGLLVGYCLCQTYAAKYGAISGFGLSLIKWAFLIKHVDCCMNIPGEHAWILWLFVVVGWVMFLKGTMTFARMKRGQPRRLFIF